MAAKRACMVLAACLLFSTLVQAQERVMIADFSKDALRSGAPAGWELKEKSGKADLALVREDGFSALRLRSADTSFSLQKEVHINLKQYPVLSWTWKVTVVPQGGDFRKSGTDDQAAQLFLAFSKTRAIVYIWDSSAAQGAMGDAAAPFFMSIKAVVMRSGRGELGRWITETRNVYDDYKKLFHEEPGEVIGVRMQINSQHTGTSAESYFGEASFQKQ